MALKTTPAPCDTSVQDLGLLKLVKSGKLFVGLLPTTYQAVIVNYGNLAWNDQISVSCILPPISHNIQIKYDLNTSFKDYQTMRNILKKDKRINKIQVIKHLAPPSLIRISYFDFPNYYCSGASYYIHIINPKIKDKILGVPYTLPNVDDLGGVCFGRVSYPKDLLSFQSSFWNSPFTNSMGSDYGIEEVKSNVDFVRRYKSLVLKKQSFGNITSEVCGKQFWSSQQKAKGLLITNNTELLKQIPDKFWAKKNSEGFPTPSPFLIALADLENDRWVFRGKSIKPEVKPSAFKFELDSQSILTSQSQNQTLLQVKKTLQVENV